MAQLDPSVQAVISLRVLDKATLFGRMTGALGFAGLKGACAIRLVRCKWIHTVFMRFEIDCVGLDNNQAVVAVYQKMPPGRVRLFPKKVTSILELRVGEAERLGITVGSFLRLDFVSDHRSVSI